MPRAPFPRALERGFSDLEGDATGGCVEKKMATNGLYPQYPTINHEIPWKRVLSFSPYPMYIYIYSSPFPSSITIIIYFSAFLQISFLRSSFYSFYRPVRVVSIRLDEI